MKPQSAQRKTLRPLNEYRLAEILNTIKLD